MKVIVSPCLDAKGKGYRQYGVLPVVLGLVMTLAWVSTVIAAPADGNLGGSSELRLVKAEDATAPVGEMGLFSGPPVEGGGADRLSGGMGLASSATVGEDAARNGGGRPIDLDTALRLGGVRNPELMIARERITEAAARRQFFAAQFLPNINVGTSYDNHTGNLQTSDGAILAVNRQSLYLGAGAFAVGAGTVAIPGVYWNAQVSDLIYNNLIAKQVVAQRTFAAEATRNDVFLRVATAYEELLRAECTLAIAIKISGEAEEVARLTEAYAKTGQGKRADANRAATEFAARQFDVRQAEGNILTTAAKLSQLLNLDPVVRLRPTDAAAVPSPIVAEDIPLKELIAMAILRRPELKEKRTVIREAMLALDNAKALPFTPTVLVGASGGTFGGGSNLSTTEMGDFAGRSDFDVAAFWTLRNLGVGNRALINQASSRLRADNYRFIQMLDQVRDEVAQAYAKTQARLAQITISQHAVLTGRDGFTEDLIRIRGREGLPIEVLDNLRLFARARIDYLNAIIDYNRAQFDLYTALGQPPANALARRAPPEQVPAGQASPEFPRQAFPGQMIPGPGLPEQPLPEQPILEQTLPGQALPGQALPGQALPGQALPAPPPERMLPGQALPGQMPGSLPEVLGQ